MSAGHRGHGSALRALLAAAVLAAVAGCGDGSHQVPESHGPLAFLHEPEAAAAGSPGPGETLVPPGNEEIESVRVRLPGHDFRVATRAGDLVVPPVQAPCSQCHGPEGAAPVPASSGGASRRAHWQVARPHGAAALACSTCHVPADPSTLRVPTVAPGGALELRQAADAGTAWPLAHSYRVCGTCHFGQLRDWAGGAHGKRLAGWSGPRVVAPCTACHDPHEPGLPQRLPATWSPPPEEHAP